MKNKYFIKAAGIIVFISLISFLYLTWGNPSRNILLNIRLPRFLLTFFVGFVLAGIGNIYQMILNNPLAEPYVLGISSGAALGSIIATISGLYLFIPFFGFIGALFTMILVWKLSTFFGDFNSIRLILSGIIVGMFFSALISLLIYFNKSDIGSIFQILMGNTGRIFSTNEWRYFLIIVVVSLVLMLYMFSLGTKLTILTSGDILASSMGVDVKKTKRIIFFISSLLVGVTVSYAGIIGFVGFIIPHITRMIFPRHIKHSTLFSSIIGANFLLICDFLAMHIAIIEIPVGIITAFVGTPFFIYLMLRKK